MTEKISLSALNQFNAEQFSAALGSIFEHSPWVADLSFEKRPFESTAHLHQVMLNSVKTAPHKQRMALICLARSSVGARSDYLSQVRT